MTQNDNHSVTDKQSQQFLAELVHILFYQPLYTILACHALAVTISVIFLWETVPKQWLSAWGLLMLVFTLIWVALVASYRRQQTTVESAKMWIHVFPIAAIFTGLSWGITAFWSPVLEDYSVTVFLAIMVLGVTAAGLAVFAPYLRSYVAFTGLTLGPFIFNYFLQDSKLHWTLGIMFLLYLSVILFSGHNMKRAVRKSIELRFENLSLVDDLLIKNRQTEQGRQDAVQADISKSKFLAAASHDLRQPLHALGLFVDALESRIQFPEVRDIVDNIRISTEALGELLNTLLDISKLDAGVLEPSISEFNLRPLLQRIQSNFSDLASEKSLKLQIVGCDFSVKTDPAMLETILLNLVSNAIRYTQYGKILLDCRRQGNQVHIAVHDTGIGIPSNEINHIFDEFYQIENPERDRRKGLGLGLAIVKRLGKLLNCPVTVNSIPNKGSIFQISVPYIAVAIPVSSKTQVFINDLQGTRVLVIDDEAMIRLGMRKVLEKWGCKVIEAESIDQALKLLNQEPTIDIILTDYRLRENETGIEAIRQIHVTYDQTIPAIILTGDTDPLRLREAKDSGFKLLHKPVSPSKLRSLMSYLLEQHKLDSTI